MDLQEIYKKESGYDVGRYNIDNTNYYSEDYVEWLEKKCNIADVSLSSDGCYECGSNNLRPKEYNCLDCGHDGYSY